MRFFPASILIAALLVLAAPAMADAAPSDMFGMNVNRVINNDFYPAHWDRPLSEVRESGFRAARTDAFWSWAEPFRPNHGVHTYRWEMLDKVTGAFAQHDLEFLPVLAYSAPWAVDGDEHQPPINPDDYAAYAAAFAARYGRGGSFWAEHPELPAKPIRTYEIWNEPNVVWFWRPGPDPARYAELYAKARVAIRAVDPAATVLIGGIVPDPSYLLAVYASRPSLRGAVDGLALHPYGQTAGAVIGHVAAIRNTLKEVGDPDIPIHVTEFGWPTSGSGWVNPIPDRVRAQALATVADTLARSDCGVESIVPYTWSTPENVPSDVQDWLGIRHPDGRPSLSSVALGDVVARWDRAPVQEGERLRICHSAGGGGGGGGNGNGPQGPAGDDADGDGLSDAAERRLGTSSDDLDSDDDGLGDGAERRTNPARADTDGDGLPDGLEAGVARRIANPPGSARGTARRGPFRADRDPRSKTRGLRRDSDGDGLRDRREDRNRNGRRDRRETDPRRPDTDGDGVRDGRDRRPLRRG